jgi:circadian clock protein KaiC
MAPGDRIPTFIRGFDEKLSGGVPGGHVVLVVGEPGTMKSTVAFNLMYHNALREDRAGTYIILEQSRASFAAHLRGLGLNPKDVEDRVSVVDLGMVRKTLEGLENRTWMEIFKMYAANLKESLEYDILVVDSLPVFEVMARFENPREELFRFFEWLRELEATTFLISEMRRGQDSYGKHGEDFIADGILHLKMVQVDDANIQRRIRCVKMRGTSHSPNYYTLLFQNGTFQITRVLAE